MSITIDQNIMCNQLDIQVRQLLNYKLKKIQSTLEQKKALSVFTEAILQKKQELKANILELLILAFISQNTEAEFQFQWLSSLNNQNLSNMHQQWRQVGFKKQVNMEQNVPVTLTYLSKTVKFEPKKNQVLQLNNESLCNKTDQEKSLIINTDQFDNQKNLYSPRVRIISPDYKLKNFLTPTSKKSKTMFPSQKKQQSQNLIKLAKGVYKSIERFKQQVNKNLERQLQKINKVMENMYKIQQSGKNISQNEIETKKNQLQQTLRSFQNLRRQLNQIRGNSTDDDFIININPQKSPQNSYVESSMTNFKNYKSSKQLISLSINPQIGLKNLKFKREPSLTAKQQITKAKGDKVFR